MIALRSLNPLSSLLRDQASLHALASARLPMVCRALRGVSATRHLLIVDITKAALSHRNRSRSTMQWLVRDGQLAGYWVPSHGREILLETGVD